jgi:glycosyltransferase involved in cell wall biosynthesis
MRISILCSDLADNAAGRAFLLARLLEPLGDVEVIGPCFGPEPWPPMAGAEVRVRAVPGRKFPAFAESMARLVSMADADLIYASKPRLASAGVGYLAALGRRRRLLLDIDDWEVGFFLRGGFWGTVGRSFNFANPAGLPWTWLVEKLRGMADGTTVASRFLEERFGGLLLPHVRDTDAWKPGASDPAEARRRLGVGAERVVMFLGTVRDYKGVEDLGAAAARLGRRDVVLAVVGADPGGPAARRLRTMYADVRIIAGVPFDDVPQYLEAADVVAVPQRDTSDTRGQVPAKLFDAMALGRPVVSTRVSMIPEILEGCGVLVPPGDVEALSRGIGHVLDHPDEAAALGQRARERAVERYSFAAARQRLFPLVERVMHRPRSRRA